MIFDQWKRDNPVNPTWDDKLPACPCSPWATRTFCDASGGFYQVKDEYIPDGWEDDLGCRGFTGMVCNWAQGLRPSTHPGAARCIRSNFTTGQPSQQCCYDSRGNLITTGVGAGSPDRNFPNHQRSDIDPWICAAELDGNPEEIKDGPHMREYLARRPANNSNGCAANSGDKLIPAM